MASHRGDEALAAIARETLQIVEANGFVTPSGARVELRVADAVAGTRAYSSEELDALLDASPSAPRAEARVEVTGETTQEATHRLRVGEGAGDVVLLNFASAVRAAGGFLQGAKAQEEDLARCSALYHCLSPQTEYYAIHRIEDSPLYSDRMIYSPRVPFFRVRSSVLLDHAYEASVITAAAPNRGRVLERDPSQAPHIEPIFRRRTGKVLALAEARGHRTLVLGAWGCGVFRNDPDMAADSFARWLESERFRGSFERVVFAVYDPHPDRPSYTAFARRLERS